jgi:tetratricopeptide (TPR) repeat protein
MGTSGAASLKVNMNQKRIADHDGLLELGWSAIDRGDYDKALTLSNVILDADPDCAEACNLRGNVRSILGHHGTAIEDFDRAIRLRPDYAEAYYFRGLSHQELKAFTDAVRDYTRAIRTGLDVAEVYNARGASRAQCGNYQSAIRDFSMAIRLKPDFALAWYNRGITHIKLDRDSVRAMADLIRAKKLGCEPAKALLNKFGSN